MNKKQRKRQLARRRAHRPSPDRPRNVISRTHYSVVKQGHVVPRMYQSNFAVDERVAVHVPGRPDCVLTHLKDAGTRSRFYRRRRPDGTEIDDVEAMLDVVEGSSTPSLREIAEGAPVTRERKSILAQFFGVQMLRGPASFAKRKVDVDQFLPRTLTRKDVTPALLARTGGDMDVAREHVIDMLRQPTHALVSMMCVSTKVSAVLVNLRWQIIRFDDPVLAYSDQPVVVWPVRVSAFQVPPRMPNFDPLHALEVRIPLSPEAAVLMTWTDSPDAPDLVTAPVVYAAQTNALVIGQADKQWMHRPGPEPPIVRTPIPPLSHELDPRYTPGAAESSRRRLWTERYLYRVRKKRFLDDIEVLGVD